MPNGPYAGPLPVRVIPPGVSGADLDEFSTTAARRSRARAHARLRSRGKGGRKEEQRIASTLASVRAETWRERIAREAEAEHGNGR